ncbi:MAG: hypothetical protein IJY01_07170 [Clostridia bacterium]|nr:hypothetical protein [Clostridia bacterium]MBQ8290630.1 hypothetical protein [Clostridia bacterium]
MKIETRNKAQRLEYFKSLYENARRAYSDSLNAFKRCMEQYRGSDEIDGSTEPAATVRNVTYEIIESQVSSAIPRPKCDAPTYSEKKERLAMTVERLCRAQRDKLPFAKLNDLDERYTYIYGGSVWFVEWNNTRESAGEVGAVDVHLISAEDFIPEPYVYDVKDMEYCFLRFRTTRGALMRKYRLDAEQASLAECECEDEAFDYADTVSLIIAFYKDDSGEVGQFIFSGDIALADNEGYYRRKIALCAACGEREDRCRCEHPKLKLDIQQSEEVSGRNPMQRPISVDYYTPKDFPIVIRKNTSGEKCLLGQSDCDYIRPQQQAINKIESRILKKLLRAGVTPVVPEDASVSVNNSVFGQVIRMKPGESMSQYGKVDTTPDVSQDIAEAERLYDHTKRVLGISDAFQGTSFEAGESGYARQLRIAQSSGRLESKRKMKSVAYAELDRLIFLHYLAFSDGERKISYKDSFGRVHREVFNRYDFLEYDVASGSFCYDDDFLFSTDDDGADEYQRESTWQRNLNNLTSGTLGDPNSSETLLRYWQCQEAAHYPGARENVEYFLEKIRKEISSVQEPIEGASQEPTEILRGIRGGKEDTE